jgi:hypothetical protein
VVVTELSASGIVVVESIIAGVKAGVVIAYIIVNDRLALPESLSSLRVFWCAPESARSTSCVHTSLAFVE